MDKSPTTAYIRPMRKASQQGGQPPSVAVVDDDVTVLTLYGSLLSAHGYRVTCHPSAEDYIESNPSPDCLILDNGLPGESGLELQRQMNRSGVLTPVIFLTSADDANTAKKAITAGAVDYQTKPADPQDLLQAVHKAIVHGAKARKELEFQRRSRELVSTLSGREFQVGILLTGGYSSKGAAARLNLSTRTVDSHRKHIAEKLETRSLGQQALIFMAAAAV